MQRRRWLGRAAGVAAVLLLTGCAGGPSASGPEPVLGTASSAPHSRGLGDARPALVDLGGASSTGVIEDVTWRDWGGPTANGTGVAAYVAPGAPLASATREVATLVADDLGTCDGHPAYRTLGFSFPAHGESAGARPPLDLCED